VPEPDAEPPSYPAGESWSEPLAVPAADPRGPRFQVVDLGVKTPLSLPHDPEDRWLDDFVGGAAFLDCDDDGDADLYLTTALGPNRLYRNDGDIFTELDAPAADLDGVYSSGASTADYDRDGDADLFVTVQFEPNRLLRNDGDCTFSDATDDAGLADSYRSLHSYWVDIERDGDLDLYVANWGEGLPEGAGGRPPAFPDQFWLNRGDGTFEERSDLLPPETAESFAMTGAFLDFDNDGDYDLFQVNDRGAQIVPNRLYRNDAEPGGLPRFVDVSDQQGFNGEPDGMGLAVADFNLDRRADFFTTGNFEELLLRQGSHYVDAAVAMGLHNDARLTWGGVAADFDADGDEDLFYVDSSFFDGGFEETDAYRGEAYHYRNDLTGPSRFERRPLEGMLADLHHWRANAGVDVDGDGLPDLYLATVERTPLIALTNPPPGSGVVEVRLRGTLSNTEGRGAVVEATVGDVVLTRWPGAADPWSCGVPAWSHFGLGEATSIDQVVVRWPSGVVQQVNDVPAGVRLFVEEPRDASPPTR